MSLITLQPLTAETWEACGELAPGPDQQDFVAAPLYSIAEAQFYPTMKLRAIVTAEAAMVGMIFYGWSPRSEQHKIVRVLIDHASQGRGYGRAAMLAALADLAAGGAREVWLSYREQNRQARRLYQSLGFQERTIEANGRITAVLTIAAPR